MHIVTMLKPKAHVWLTAGLFVLVGTTYSLLWGPGVDDWLHGVWWPTSPQWAFSTDFLLMAQASANIWAGHLGLMYSQHGGGSRVVAFPGFEVLFMPVTWVATHLGLSFYGGRHVDQPSAWPILLAGLSAYAVPVLFALDNLARRMGIPLRRRVWLSLAQAGVLFSAVYVWGHVEDVLALAFAIWGYNMVRDGRWAAAGWLWGLSIACQPVIALALPITMASLHWRRWVPVLWRAAVLPASLASMALAADFRTTWFVFTKQPMQPAPNHPTPWLALASHLSQRSWMPASPNILHPWTTAIKAGPHALGYLLAQYSPGPTRYLMFAVAIGLAWWAKRRGWTPQRLLWAFGVCLALRVIFEPVMTPYYVWPALAVLLVACAQMSARRLAVGILAALGCWMYAYHQAGPWAYWLGVTAFMGIGYLVADRWIKVPLPMRRWLRISAARAGSSV